MSVTHDDRHRAHKLRSFADVIARGEIAAALRGDTELPREVVETITAEFELDADRIVQGQLRDADLMDGSAS